jgi:uncharacterized protein YjbI with pentapeptide repeats
MILIDCTFRNTNLIGSNFLNCKLDGTIFSDDTIEAKMSDRVDAGKPTEMYVTTISADGLCVAYAM